MSALYKKNPVVMACSVLAYVCVFYAIHAVLGRGVAIAVFLPVMAAAWCFGTFWGIVAALLSVFANSALCVLFGIDWLEHVAAPEKSVPGIAAMVFIAWVLGYMRTLHMRLQRKVDEVRRVADEQREAGEELRELMRFSDNVIESSIDSIVVGDEHGTIVRVNRALLEMSGYSREELIGQSPLVLSNIVSGDYLSTSGETIRIDDAYMEKARELHGQLFETGRIPNWEYYILRKDGRLVPTEGSIVLLRDESGSPNGSLAIIRDISRRRVIEKELERHRAHLHDMVQAKTAQLQAREQELQAANQQLMAANDQLRRSEQALRESEERFRAVVQLANEAIVIIDEQGTIISWNRGAEKIYGYTPDEILGQPVLRLVPEAKRTLHGNFLAVISTQQDMPGLQATAEGIGQRKDGSTFTLEFSITRWETSGSKLYGFIVRDITARKKAEVDLIALNERLRESNDELRTSRRALEQSEQQFRRLVETMNEGLLVRDSSGLFSYMNDRFCEILGYDRGELLGRTVDDFLAEKDSRILRRQVAERVQGGYEAYEMSWLRRDGTTVITSVSPRPIFDEHGSFQGSFAVITDITAQKHLQHQRRESREFLENIFRTTNDGIVVSDTDGRIMRVNTTIENMLGYDEQEMVGVSALDFFPHEEECRSQALEMAAVLREKGAVQNWETEWCRKDGSRLPVEINVTFLRDRDGSPTGAVAAVRDITERRGIEQQLLQTEKLKSLGEMASGVAHDFNNVLTAILGRAQLVRRMVGGVMAHTDTAREAEIEKSLGVIEDAALDGAETVRRIQDFSRAGTSQRFSVSVDLAEVISGALDYTRARWKDDAELKGLSYRIENTVRGPLPVVGNASELREVFTNFINNSLDAMPDGGCLSFSAECGDTTVSIAVRDTGAGIPAGIISRIFDPFFTTKGPQSTGLGMSVSYGIIRRHRGTISIHSEEGSGAEFTVVLPLGRVQERIRPDVASVTRGSRLQVLVIDDDEDVREVLADILSGEGHRVESAVDGPSGVELFREKHFDLVFTDLGMPGISGWDVAREIKSIREQALLVLVTGWDVHYQQDNIDKYRIDFVLNKPFQVSHIMDVVSMAHKRLEGVY